MQPIVNDFFCGCGGMGVGFLNAGYKIAGAWDFDKYAVQSYDHNVGHHVKQADIKEMTWQDVPFAHVWAFGFPCQDLSVAGKQAGLLLKCQDCDSDFAIDPSNFTGQTTCPSCGSKNYKAASRSGCFYEIMRLIDETREHAPSSLCRLFLPTESELFGDCCYSEDDTYSQIEYYKDRRNRIKCNRKGGSPDWYWTASVRSGTSASCVGVGSSGHSSHWGASHELYVPVCFVIQ